MKFTYIRTLLHQCTYSYFSLHQCHACLYIAKSNMFLHLHLCGLSDLSLVLLNDAQTSNLLPHHTPTPHLHSDICLEHTVKYSMWLHKFITNFHPTSH